MPCPHGVEDVDQCEDCKAVRYSYTKARADYAEFIQAEREGIANANKAMREMGAKAAEQRDASWLREFMKGGDE